MENLLEILINPNPNGYIFRCKTEENLNDYSIEGENKEACPKVKVSINFFFLKIFGIRLLNNNFYL